MSASSGFQRKKVRAKESFSARLARMRHEQNLSLAGVEDEIKIREHHLEHIESGNFERLPASHAKGFIRRYARFLGLSEEEITTELVYIDTLGTSHSLFSPRKIGREPKWIVTPKTVVFIFVAIFVLLVIGYIFYQVKQFSAPPNLVVSEPKDQAVLTSEQLAVTGSTDPGSTVTIDELQANVTPQGDFRYELTLRPGLNQITIRSVNRIKKVTEKTVTILYELPVSPSPLPSVSPTTKP